MTAPLTLDAKGVAELVGWHHEQGYKVGKPRTDEVYRLTRDDLFPQPVNPTCGVRRWRWSRCEIEDWCRHRHNGGAA